MASEIVTIKPETHKNTKIKTSRNLDFCKNMNIVPVIVPEYSNNAANCPIVFVRDADNTRFVTAALLGLEQDENLFYVDDVWEGTHVPMNVGRVPFTLKRVEETQTVSAALDMNSEFISEDEGEALFDDDGKETEYFQRVNTFLATLFDGEVATQKFSKAIADNGVLKEFKILIEQGDGKIRELTGLWTPDINTIQNLADSKVLEFHKEGFLAAAHVIVQSMTQMTRLVKLKNDQAGEVVIKAVRIEMVEPEGSIVKS